VRRSRLAPRSQATIDAADDHWHIRHAVFARDGYRCVLAAHQTTTTLCGGDLTFGHRRKSGAGGAYTVENGLAQCAVHNGHIEDEPRLYRDLFGDWLVVREGDPEWEQLGQRAARLAAL
jgi:hypothetical protein